MFIDMLDRLIFALDVPSANDALRLVELLAGHVGCFKIGLELFIAAGPAFVEQVVKQAPVFLDLKLHDIPATVGRAAAVAGKMGVRYLTVHADEGGRAVQAAVENAPQTNILCVTVLTSVSEEDLTSIGYSLGVTELVKRRAIQAQEAGCGGIICSGYEVSELRELLGSDFRIITPGIRLSQTDVADQRRVVTPAKAIQCGADMIVVGRPIRDAPEPIIVADQIVSEMASVSKTYNV